MTTSSTNQPAANQPATGAPPVPLHKKYKRVSQKKPKAAPAPPNLEQQALSVVSSPVTEQEKLAGLLKLAVGSISGTTGFFVLHEDEKWRLAAERPYVGRTPAPEFFDATFSEKCDTFIVSGTIKTWNCEALDGMLIFSIPLRQGEAAEQMLIVAPAKTPILESTKRLTRLAAAMRLWLGANEAREANWQVASLASIIDIVSQIETQTTLDSACEEAVNLVANQLPVTHAAIGMIEGSTMKLKAISGISKLDTGSRTGRSWLQAMVESEHRKDPGLHPAIDQENNFLLQSHRRLAADLQVTGVFSQPLVAEDGTMVGALVYAGEANNLAVDGFWRFNAAAGPALAAAVRSAKGRQKNAVSRGWTWLKEKIKTMPGVLASALLIVFVLLMLLPVTYRVRCTVITEPVSRRFAVAPFAGQIIEGRAEAGDFVSAGDVLAELDGRTINWELIGVTAEREQSVTSRRMELSERNIPKAILASLENERLRSEEEVLRYKKDHLQVRSPIDGIVLSGSLEQAEAASVETGQTLFEIGPVKPMRIEIEIPANEIAQTKPGFPVSIWIDGQEDNVIEGEIVKIRPRSTTRQANNVFIAEVEFPNEDERLRPGMEGTARIDCERRSLGWTMFHKPMNWVRANFSYF